MLQTESVEENSWCCACLHGCKMSRCLLFTAQIISTVIAVLSVIYANPPLPVEQRRRLHMSEHREQNKGCLLSRVFTDSSMRQVKQFHSIAFKNLFFFFLLILRLFYPVRVSKCYSRISPPFIPQFLDGENEPWLCFGVLPYRVKLSNNNPNQQIKVRNRKRKTHTAQL